MLAADFAAPVDLPAEARAVMDGFAVRGADVATAGEGAPTTLRVVGSVPMGDIYRGQVVERGPVETVLKRPSALATPAGAERRGSPGTASSPRTTSAGPARPRAERPRDCSGVSGRPADTPRGARTLAHL